MIRQNVHIIDLNVIYNVLEEINSLLPFQIFNHNNLDNFLNLFNSNKIDLGSSIILLKPGDIKFIENNKVDKRMLFSIDNVPIELTKLIEKINIRLIKQKYNYQSKIDIKNYIINLNSRIITQGSKTLKLTEKEINIILFLNDKDQPQSINTLQNQVWRYSSELETHTVETHVYRLRKKIKDTFNDDKFILSHDNGYSIL